MSLFSELQEENEKSQLFKETDIGVSYMLNMPILDQQLGFKQMITLPDGTIKEQYRLGVPAGKITIFTGPSSSGKTAAAIQSGWSIVEPYGEDAGLVIIDAEQATEAQRVLDLTGMSLYDYNERVILQSDPDIMTFESTVEMVHQICLKKESDKKRFMYKTGFYDVNGHEIETYLPTAVVIDSLMKILPKDELSDIEKMPGLTTGGRNAIHRGSWLSKLVSMGTKFNINYIIVNHLGNDIQMQPGKGGAKQLTFIPTGKNMPGGEKVIYYSSSIVVWQPINSKDTIKTADINGYNGLPVRAAVAKSRSGPGGTSALLEFIQESGFDARLTLVNLAKEHNLICGRNPKCYFATNPDVTFDTRIFLRELAEKPDILKELYKSCKPVLESIVRQPVSDDDFIGGKTAKLEARSAMRDMFRN